jgi:branched-chain amino acid transport system permease protein
MIAGTRFGAQLRASVDNPRTARGSASTSIAYSSSPLPSVRHWPDSAVRSGSRCSASTPEFPVKYIVYFLIVVAVGGSGNIKGSLYASLIIGICDVAGKYYIPQVGPS